MNEVILHYNPKDDRYYLYYGEDYLADSVSMTTIMQIFGPAVEKAQESKGEALLSEVIDHCAPVIKRMGMWRNGTPRSNTRTP